MSISRALEHAWIINVNFEWPVCAPDNSWLTPGNLKNTAGLARGGACRQGSGALGKIDN
jgi:hypothetical protein